VARHIFQACPVWIHTQSNITNNIYNFNKSILIRTNIQICDDGIIFVLLLLVNWSNTWASDRRQEWTRLCFCGHYTRKKFAQVVTNLQQTCSNVVPTTCQQDVFALLVPSLWTSCQRLVDNLLQGCWAQQTCYKLFQQLVIVLQFNNLSTSCEWQPFTSCNKPAADL
jgi:hypothetical protein